MSTSTTQTWNEAIAAAARVVGERDARLIVGHVADWNAAELIAHGDEVVNAKCQASIDQRVERRRAGEPLQYVLGAWGFRQLDLYVDRRVLIPRPETEWVVEVALAALRALRYTNEAPTVVDLGTGSGAIALSIAKEVPDAHVWATDASADALEVARLNLIGLGQAAIGRVDLKHGDWFDALPDALMGMITLVVSNPPYVRTTDALPAEVADWEPASALVAGHDGLDDIRRIVAATPDWLARPGALVVEHAPDQGDAIQQLMRAGGAEDVSTHNDLVGRPRCTVGKW
ncbi:MAG TPA: peptide chain release factor N(5)-glutamine methyltransferase [Acidimicrobiales bacterium]|nr:peptide chain release factor N(5)-glutamine methyltransferase [Acidimicrobiales bacterium]